MGSTGPCGPCSEIHFYLGDDPTQQDAGPDLDSEDYVEIWNLVFIQYNRGADGILQPLPAQHVDTGMGFERICSILQGVQTTYDTDVFLPVIGAISEITRKPYNKEHQVPIRVIADHVRTLAFAIADGVLPSNEGRGYVLRRILRRAARFGRSLGMHEPFIFRLIETVVREMSVAFPEVKEKRDYIERVIRSEEEGFGKTLDRGLEIFDAMQAKGHISGTDAFQLYDTYGFPIDLTRLMAAEKGIEVDEEGFEAQMAAQQERSRSAASFDFQVSVSEVTHIPESKFVGYETLVSDSRIVACQPAQDEMLDLYLDITPFYAESGGQVGDTGEIVGDGVCFEVATTLKAGEAIVHRGRLCDGQVEGLKGMDVKARVDAETRLNTARNHTATHLMHRALRQVLGDHVLQAGSLVAPDRLRFDFTHFEGVTPAQLDDIVGIVNDAVRRDWSVDISFETLKRAKKMGAMMLFGEKYGDEVRMVQVGDFSLELCGGTHVQSTGQIGLFQLTQETGTAAGVRRIEAVTGSGAEALVREQKKILVDLSSQLSASTSELSDKVAHLIAHNRELERELQSLRRERAGSEMDMLVNSALNVNGLRVVAAEVSPPDMDGFRTMGDGLRDALGTGGVGVIGANLNGKASLLAVVTDDLIGQGVQAGNVVKAIAQIVGGGGGGRPHLAQAGGKFPEKIGEALARVPDIIRAQVGG